MSEFKVGDIVRRTAGDHAGMFVGYTDEVVAVGPNRFGNHDLTLTVWREGHASRNFEVVRPEVSQQEADPTGRDPHQPGAKLDAGKVEFDLIMNAMPRALRQVARVATYGANKYTRDGWLAVPDARRRYTAAMYRHLNQEACGELHDADTQLEHAAHAAWNALARLELLLRGEGTDQ